MQLGFVFFGQGYVRQEEHPSSPIDGLCPCDFLPLIIYDGEFSFQMLSFLVVDFKCHVSVCAFNQMPSLGIET